jgi:hypothetical protein
MEDKGTGRERWEEMTKNGNIHKKKEPGEKKIGSR